MSEFGFFFFLRMAVAVSSFWGGSVIMPSERRVAVPYVLDFSARWIPGEHTVRSRLSKSAGGEQTHLDRSTLGVV
jgi:hypothetical protein